MADYINEIISCCKALRLSSSLAARAASIEGSSNQEYLFRLLMSEIEYREKSRASKLMASAGFPIRYAFKQFRADEVQFPSDVTLDRLKSLEFIGEKKNIIMYGGTGTGKTMLSICIGVEACQKGLAVQFFRTAALVNRLSESKSRGQLSSFIKKLNKAAAIILDEFGYVPYDRTGTQLLFDYLSEIDRQKAVILNTNLEFSRWVNVLYSEQMTAALVGRLTHRCHLLLFPGDNYRLRESSINEVYRSIADRQRNSVDGEVQQ